jgi:hypothetical protein
MTPVGWKPICLLPNIHLQQSVGCDVAVLASQEDERVAALTDRSPALKVFLNAFRDQQGEEVKPSLVLLRSDTPGSLQTAEAVAGFRDSLCAALVPICRARFVETSWTDGPIFSDVFEIYPWMTDSLGERLTAWTQSIAGVWDIYKFRGQSSPQIYPASAGICDFDAPVLSEILKRWERRFSGGTPPHEDVALFRSLNMAFHAMKVPAGQEHTHYDTGRLIALWVSALEILIHPGRGSVGEKNVLAFAGRIDWLRDRAGANFGSPEIREVTSCLIKRFYQRRNDYLHGNPVDAGKLSTGARGRSLSLFAAPLFRMMLTAFLHLKQFPPSASESDKDISRHICERMSYAAMQAPFEDCLMIAA